jgi:hypothetical protein
VASFQQCVAGSVSGADAIGEPVAPPRRDQRPVGRRRLGVLVSGRSGDEDVQALAVVGDGPLGGFAEVVPQMPAISDLRRPGCPQALGPPAVPPGRPRHLLDKRPLSARRIRAEEPADPQAEHYPPPRAENIGGKPQVGAVNSPRMAPTAQTRRLGRRTAGLDACRLVVHVHRQHRHVRDRREQQPLQPEQCLFHNAELSATLRLALIISRQFPGG